MSTAAIIVAAGRGTRAGGKVAKQWQMLAGRRVLDWTVEAFRGVTGVNRIVLVLHPAELSRAAGYPGVVAVNCEQEYGAYLEEGDEIYDFNIDVLYFYMVVM